MELCFNVPDVLLALIAWVKAEVHLESVRMLEEQEAFSQACDI
jgi:hypothetical protein